MTDRTVCVVVVSGQREDCYHVEMSFKGYCVSDWIVCVVVSG